MRFLIYYIQHQAVQKWYAQCYVNGSCSGTAPIYYYQVPIGFSCLLSLWPYSMRTSTQIHLIQQNTTTQRWLVRLITLHILCPINGSNWRRTFLRTPTRISDHSQPADVVQLWCGSLPSSTCELWYSSCFVLCSSWHQNHKTITPN